MQREGYFLYHSKTNAFWMCDTDVARFGDLRCRQCNAITEDNGLLFFGPCTSHRQHHFEYSLRNHKRAVGGRLFLALPRLSLRGPFVENGAHSFAIEPQTESILRCKLRNLCLPIFLIQWPKAFQVPLVNRAVLPLAVHLAFDLPRQRFRCFAI